VSGDGRDKAYVWSVMKESEIPKEKVDEKKDV